jgi:cyclophilin family peptidyl-prolyl cis-trans isomerase
MGNIIIQMRDDKPITTQNFVNLVNQGMYDGTIFHRVSAGFMIQGGVVQQNLPFIPDEIGPDNHNFNGTIAMANAGPNTATSSFFINVNDNNNSPGFDDSAYAVFGRVIGGMDVVMNISRVAVGPSSYIPNENSAPLQTITLLKAIVLP